MRSQSVAHTEDIVAGIYEAALLPDRWPAALQSLARHVGADTADLYAWSESGGYDASAPSWGVEASMREQYRAHFQAIDPLRDLVRGHAQDAVFACTDHLDEDTVMHSAFHQDFLLSWGHRYLAAVPLVNGPERFVAFSMMRAPERQGFDAAARARIAALAPHLRAAMALGERLAASRGQPDLATMALDRIATAALVVGAEGRILAANAAADAVLSDGGMLGGRQGRLTAADGSNDSLVTAQRAATRARAPVARAWRGRGRTDGRVCTALFVPLPERWTGRPAALALLDGAGPAAGWAPVDDLRRLFGLTRAEQELANGLLEGLSLEDIATRRAVRIGTLKVQLRTLLAKTGARRQSDLLRRLAPFARLRSEPVVRRPLHRATIGT